MKTKLKNGWIYIPYSPKYDPSKFYDNRKVMSFNTRTVGVIGARRIGKTFTFKKMVTRDFLQHNRPFVWLRDNDEARKQLASNGGSGFFKDFKKMKLDDFDSGAISSQRFIINGKDAGGLMPCSTFQNFKGNDYSDVYNVVYDEFIRELNRNKTKAEAWEIINSLYTILSTRKDCRIILLANALDRGNAFLQLIECELGDYGFYLNRKRDIVIEYCNISPKFKQEQEDSTVGKLIVDTPFESNLFEGEFEDDTSLYFIKLPSKCKLQLIINGYVNIRLYTKDGRYYASNDINPDAYINKRYVANISDVTENIPFVGNILLKKLKEIYATNNIRFASPFLKKAFCEMLSI